MAKFCINCGAPIREGEARCSRCGNAVSAASAQPVPSPQPAYQAAPPQSGSYQAPQQQPPAYQAPVAPQGSAYQTPPQQPPAYQAPPPQGSAYQTPPQQPPAYQSPQAPAYQAPPPQASYQVPPQSPAYRPAAPSYQYGAPSAAKAKGGAKTGLIIGGIVLGVAALAVVVVLALSGGKKNAGGEGDEVVMTPSGSLSDKVLADADLPAISYSYVNQEKSVDVDFSASETIYPSLYSTMDSVVNLTATSEGGDTEALVRVEIPGFTQAYEQKVTLSSQITKIYAKPPLLTGDIDLTSSKDAQINITVSDVNTGKIYARESRKVKLMSVYDFALWSDEFGMYSDYALLAWLTPESEGILSLRRTAISWLEYYTDGQLNSMPGYQLALFGEDEYWLNVIWQVIGVQAAMSELGMRYNMGSFSMTEGANQRVLLPDDCLYSGSGVCIETALIMASAIQSANMHAMLILPPGHAQVAIEDWDQSGDYWLIETTMLPFDGESDWDSFVRYLDSDQWLAYLEDPWGDGSGPCFVIDCDMATPLGITGFVN